MNRRGWRIWIAVLAFCSLLGAAEAVLASSQLARRTFQESFSVEPGETLRLANLAGTVELVSGSGPEVRVEVTVYAKGRTAQETQRLLSGMKWVGDRDAKGSPQWSLSYPVNEYRGFHYPGWRGGSTSGWLGRLLEDLSRTTTHYLGQRVTVYSRPGPDVPTLYTDLRVSLPAGASLAVRNGVGAVRGGELEGRLKVATGGGGVEIRAFAGVLEIDTGSGDVILGTVRGETEIDTGSGDIRVDRLVGNAKLDTGSGDVQIQQVAAGRLEVDTGSGDVTVRNGSAGKLAVDTGSGSIRAEGVEFQSFYADTGSGDVTVKTTLAEARELMADTGSGDVRIFAGPEASFELSASQGSGDLVVDYPDATYRQRGRRIVGASRGNGRTQIRVRTGSGDCWIGPRS